MPGGLMNLTSYGNSNIIIFGNPQKTFFKTKYKSITNFGMQRFRIDQEGTKSLNYTTESEFIFKIKRYGDLLYETFLVLDLPDIWSPPYFNEEATNTRGEPGEWTEYGFRWVNEIGTTMIKEIEINSGGYVLARYDGEYLSCVAHRDYSYHKLKLWNNMTGNVNEIHAPEYAYNRYNTYPSAYYNGTTNIRPSIIGRKIYVPIGAWFTLSPGQALPLISLQYTEMIIKVKFRPLKELYQIRDVTNFTERYPYRSPNTARAQDGLYQFLSPPEDVSGNVTESTANVWNADPHLIAKYIFLDKDEQTEFAKQSHQYLIRDVYTYDRYNATGTRLEKFETNGLVSNYMFRFRRSDVASRNEWNNYTNWLYHRIPYNVLNENIGESGDLDGYATPSTYIYTTGNYDPVNENTNRSEILQSMAILLNGEPREYELDGGVYAYMEKFNTTKGASKDGLYMYSFSLDTVSTNYQPSGGFNMDKYKDIQFQLQTIEPPLDPSSSYTPLCDADGNVIGTRQNIWETRQWNYDMKVYEERFNMVIIKNGAIGLLYPR